MNKIAYLVGRNQRQQSLLLRGFSRAIRTKGGRSLKGGCNLFCCGIFVSLLAVSATGCLGHFTTRQYQPSPVGDLVATSVRSSWVLALPAPEKIDFSHSLSFEVWRVDGKRLFAQSLVHVRNEWRLPVFDYAWSPSGQALAMHFGGNLVQPEGSLEIVHIPSGKRDVVVREGVTEFRWIDESNLIYFEGGTNVWRFSLLDGKRQLIFNGGEGRGARSEVGQSGRSSGLFSPRGESIILPDKGTTIRFVNLGRKTKDMKFLLRGERNGCWWNNAGDTCLIQAMTTNSPYSSLYYLFDRASGDITDITQKLENLGADDGKSHFWPCNVSYVEHDDARVWSFDGRCLMITEDTGIMNKRNTAVVIKDWICRVRPWSAICVQDQVGDTFIMPTFAPKGNYIAVLEGGAKISGPWHGNLCVFRYLSAPDGRIHLTKPVKVTSGIFEAWMWSGDGEKLITFNGKKFESHEIPTIGE